MKQTFSNPMHKLIIRTVDKTKPVTHDLKGRQWVATQWTEVSEANIGSMTKPNKEILEFKFVPRDYEIQQSKNRLLTDLNNFLKDRFDGEFRK